MDKWKFKRVVFYLVDIALQKCFKVVRNLFTSVLVVVLNRVFSRNDF